MVPVVPVTISGTDLIGVAAIISAIGSSLAAVLAAFGAIVSNRTHDLVNGKTKEREGAIRATAFDEGKAAQLQESEIAPPAIRPRRRKKEGK